jgi:hypothetical protein
MKRIAAIAVPRYEIVNHGIDTPSYFPGIGVSHTPYTHVAVGIGDNAKAAYQDAVDQIYTTHDSAQAEALRLPRKPHGIRKSDSVSQACPGTDWDDSEEWPQYYVAILYTI